MSTYERRRKIKDPRIEEGHEVFYCELRGYDSPDRWHEVFLHGEKIAELGPREREKAIAMCKRTHHPKTRYERLMSDNDDFEPARRLCDRDMSDDEEVPQDPEAE